jgi:cytoskeletal protein RodZ
MPTDQLNARSLAQARLAARRARIALIRRRVVLASAAFVAAIFIALLVQLSVGHDPALVAKASTRPAASQPASDASSSSAQPTTTTTTTAPDNSSAPPSSSAPASSAAPAGPTPVITSQS